MAANLQSAVSNPILPGFNPDPSICRVGDDYYIATSTFEWYPGVQIYHSTDLLNWKLVARPLNRADLLDMTGCPDSCGVWAPCLSWCDGLFYLVYTDVKRFDGNFKDTHNYLTTCETIDGEWSDRVYLNSSGFDPSLFHDDDGRKYLLNMLWDHRPDRSFFAGILLQEFSPEENMLFGPIKNIFPGSDLGLTEGPHLYKLNGYYYLLTAEGGTGYEHAMTLARSKNICGPYELDPKGNLITARFHPAHPLQRAGHGDIAQTASGDWLGVHLCSRPLSAIGKGPRRSPMGRETALVNLVFDAEGWLRQAGGEQAPALQPVLKGELEKSDNSCFYDFSRPELPLDFQWLRTPNPQRLFSLDERPSCLRLYGREALGSCFHVSLVARRQQAFCYSATTKMDFRPENFQQMAGLLCYYNAHKFHYLYLTASESSPAQLGIMSCLADQSLAVEFPLTDECPINATSIYLRATVAYAELQFYFSLDGNQWQAIGPQLDYSILSDEAGKGEGANFTGAFVGLSCQDSSGQQAVADFHYLDYRESSAN